MVTYEIASEGPIVFTVQVEGFGPVVITSRKPRIFNGRLPVAPILKKALRLVEQFAEQHQQELAPHYEAVAQRDNAPAFASAPAEKCA